MYLLDTCVLSELTKRRPEPAVIEWVDAVDEASLFISVITVGEIRKGIARLAHSARRGELETWLEMDLLGRFANRILPFDVETLLFWGALTARLEGEGRPLPAVDSLIAATSLHNHLALVTRNVKDFEGTGLVIVNPWSV